MPVSRKINDVKRRHEASLMEMEGVTGVAIGELSGKPCIVVYLAYSSPELRARIPRVLEGHPVRVEESGEIQIQAAT